MNQSEFITTLKKKPVDYGRIFNKLYQGVVETNKLFGLNLESMSESEISELVNTYFLLRQEEGKEIFEALETFNKVEMLDGLIDLCVVVGFEWYLLHEKIFENTGGYFESIEEALVTIKHNLQQGNWVACNKVLNAAEYILTQIDVDLEKAVDEVLASNRSKAPTIGEFKSKMYEIYPHYHNLYEHKLVEREAMAEFQCIQIEKQGRYGGVHCKPVYDPAIGEKRLTFWANYDRGEAKHKFVKPCTYFDADFASCWKS